MLVCKVNRALIKGSHSHSPSNRHDLPIIGTSDELTLKAGESFSLNRNIQNAKLIIQGSSTANHRHHHPASFTHSHAFDAAAAVAANASRIPSKMHPLAPDDEHFDNATCTKD